MAPSASCVLRSFSIMKAFFTAMALSNAARAVESWPWLRASAPRTCSSRMAKLPARSSRPAWMAALVLAVRSLISFLYFASSLSSSVALAFTMAIDSFMRGTWSFMSRMFCSRMIVFFAFVFPWLQFDPAKHESKKHRSKTNRGHSGRAKKPFVRKMTPQRSCGCQFINADTHCHQDDQERDSTKGEWTCPESKDQSECATSKAIQQQKPGFALSGTPNAGCDRASSCRQCEHTHMHKRPSVVHKCTQSQGSIRALHKKVHDGIYRVKNATQCQ